MRLDFNVLWLDDQPDRVQAQIGGITRQMAEEAFAFNPTLCHQLSEVEDRLADGVFSDEVDLILVDWDLGSGMEGQDAIAKIRETIPYKDVVFYSAQTSPRDLRKYVYEKGLEGVYCASREDLVEEVVGVFDSLIKKVLDLDHSRGIVMGATSDIDNAVNECLVIIQGIAGDALRGDILTGTVEIVREHVERITKSFEKFENAQSLDDVIEAHDIFTAYHRLRLLARVLKSKELDGHHDLRTNVVKYMDTVVPQRNRLGHAVLSPAGRPKVLADVSGNEVSLEETRKLRREILELRQTFRDLLDRLRDGAA